MFFISIKDPEAPKAARLQVKFDRMEKVEYTMSPDVDKSGDTIYMLKDYSRGLVAHKDYRLRMCLVGKLNDTEDSARQRAKAFKNKLIQVASTENFLILNGSIHPDVLTFAAGRRIANYCNELNAYWLVRLSDSDVTSDPFGRYTLADSFVNPAGPNNGFIGKQSTTDGVEAGGVFGGIGGGGGGHGGSHAGKSHNGDAEAVIVAPAEEEEEDVKMQILTADTGADDESNGGLLNLHHTSDGGGGQPELIIPPQDTERLQEFEDQVVLEEKLGVQASEKLETPREAEEHLASTAHLEVKVPSSNSNNKEGSQQGGATGNSSPGGDDDEQSSTFVFDGRSFNDDHQPSLLNHETTGGNSFTATTGNDDDEDEDVKIFAEEIKELHTSADEKSNVEKAPHLIETTHSPARLTKDELVVMQNDYDSGSINSDESSPPSQQPMVILMDGTTTVSTTRFDSTSASISSTTDGSSAVVLTDSTRQNRKRRRRRQTAAASCKVRCWYFIRKLKGYRRCVYKCF